jgi:hypothetical protein
VGIYDGTHIYHYSNGGDVVVRQTPEAFLARFQAIYAGDQALYYGTMPAGAVLPESESAAAAVPLALAQDLPPPAQVSIRTEVSGGRTSYYAKVAGGAEFYLARETRYSGYRGLLQPSGQLYGPVYELAAHVERFGPPAALVGVIAMGGERWTLQPP